MSVQDAQGTVSPSCRGGAGDSMWGPYVEEAAQTKAYLPMPQAPVGQHEPSLAVQEELEELHRQFVLTRWGAGHSGTQPCP